MPLVRTTKHELFDLVGIFLIFWYPPEQILGPGGQAGPGPNTFHRTPKTRIRTFFPAILTDLPTYIRGSFFAFTDMISFRPSWPKIILHVKLFTPGEMGRLSVKETRILL